MSKSKSTITRRTFLAGTAAGVVLAGCGGPSGDGGGEGPAAAAAGTGPKPSPKGRVVILGFDGAEPTIIQDMIDRGETPNFAKLAQQGSFQPLHTTIPPQSPVAWTSFTTCKNPGGHNIYDFIRRDPMFRIGPIPMPGTGTLDHPKFSADGTLTTPAQLVSYRKGDAFWKVADTQGLRCKVFNVPFSTPAEPMERGVQLCGLGVTDLRGTTSISFALSEAFTPADVKATLSGGQRVKLDFGGSDTTVVAIEGPRNTLYENSRNPNAYTKAQVKLTVDRRGGKGLVEVDGKKIELAPATWSEWIALPFKMTNSYTAYGIARFYPLEIGEQVRLHMTCVQIDPAEPYAKITQPVGYAKELYDRYGLFKTIGWHYDTHALRQDRLDEDAFLKEIRDGMAWREKLTLDELDRGEFDMLISAWTATDRVGHMFWRFRDPKHPMYDPVLAEKFATALEETYRTADSIVGKVMEKLQPNDLLIVISDHGFESWRRGFNVNAWLESNGYLTVKNRAQAKDGLLLGLDWAKTTAYAVGLSSMYLNVSGRERFGSVGPAQVDNLIAELKDKLLQVKDDQTGGKVFSNIYTRHDFSGVAVAEAPDISFGYDNFHQSSETTRKGAVADTHFSDNNDKWSGEHSSSDVARLPGIFFCSKPVEATDPNILDMGVTALGYLGADVPGDFEGRDLFA